MISIAIAALFAAGQSAATPPPDAAAMRAAAAGCHLPADWLRIGHDEDGDYADPSTAHRDPPAPDAVLCIIHWAGETHARIGFLNEPPPGPQALAAIPQASAVETIRAAEQCGLLVRVDPVEPGRALLITRRHPPAAPLASLRTWLNAHGISTG